jgi:hypothetical protein
MPRWQPSEVAGIVARLIPLLPGAAAAPPQRAEPKQSSPPRPEPILRDRPSRSRSSWTSTAAWLLCLALVTAAAFAALSDGMPAEDRSGAPIAVHSSRAPADCQGDCLQQFQFNKEMGYGQGSKTQ